MSIVSILTVTNRPSFRRWNDWVVSQQTHGDVEHIVVDGSHGNLGKARLEAQQRARGKWCIWLDDDDYWHPEYLATLVRHAERTQASVVWWPINPDIRINLQTLDAREHWFTVPIPHRDWLWLREVASPMDASRRRLEEMEWIAEMNSRRDLQWCILPHQDEPLRLSLEHEQNVSEQAGLPGKPFDFGQYPGMREQLIDLRERVYGEDNR